MLSDLWSGLLQLSPWGRSVGSPACCRGGGGLTPLKFHILMTSKLSGLTRGMLMIGGAPRPLPSHAVGGGGGGGGLTPLKFHILMTSKLSGLTRGMLMIGGAPRPLPSHPPPPRLPHKFT